MPKRKSPKSFFELSAAQRDAEVAKYEGGVPFEKTRALSPEERARWERARNGARGPVESGTGVPVILRIDPKLLARAHAAARRDGKTLSEFISDLLSKRSRRAG